MEPATLEVYARSARLVREVWRRLERRLKAYPGQIGRYGATFLKSIGGDGERYFSSSRATPLLHLPIWMASRLTQGELVPLLEASGLAYFHARIQDDVLDEPLTRGRPEWLLLSNCLIWDATSVFLDCSTQAGYRRLCRAALAEFSRATATERRILLRPDPRYAIRSFAGHAGKAALAAIPLYAVAARQGDLAKMRHVMPLVRTLGMAYGLTNDLQGFERDLAAGHNTFLITELKRRALPATVEGPAGVEQALYRTDVVERTLARAIRYHDRARPFARLLGMSSFSDYTDQRIRWLRGWTREATLGRLAQAIHLSVTERQQR
jgi:hypothetical protein